MRRQMQEKMEIGASGNAFEAVSPGRSLVPAAQAQAGRSRYASTRIGECPSG